MLASCPDGCTEAVMQAHGFTSEQIVELMRAGLATAQAEHVEAGARRFEVNGSQCRRPSFLGVSPAPKGIREE